MLSFEHSGIASHAHKTLNKYNCYVSQKLQKKSKSVAIRCILSSWKCTYCFWSGFTLDPTGGTYAIPRALVGCIPTYMLPDSSGLFNIHFYVSQQFKKSVAMRCVLPSWKWTTALPWTPLGELTMLPRFPSQLRRRGHPSTSHPSFEASASWCHFLSPSAPPLPPSTNLWPCHWLSSIYSRDW